MKSGFSLIYSVIIGGLIFITAGIFLRGAFFEIIAAREEEGSLKAFYAADTGTECVRFYNGLNQAFDPMTEKKEYDCGVGTFEAGSVTPPPLPSSCENGSKVYNLELDGFSNGAVANVEVRVVPRSITIEGQEIWVCDLIVISNGRNSRSVLDPNLVERTRWENM